MMVGDDFNACDGSHHNHHRLTSGVADKLESLNDRNAFAKSIEVLVLGAAVRWTKGKMDVFSCTLLTTATKRARN